MAKTNTKLKNAQEIIKEYALSCGDFDEKELIRLRNETEEFKDTRHQSYVRHRIGDVVVIVFLALLSEADEWKEIELFAKKKEQWLRKFLILENGIPSHDTIQSIISMLDSNVLFSTCMNFLLEKVNAYAELARHDDPFKKSDTAIISIDGKTSRGSSRQDTGEGKTKPVHTLNAVSSDYGFCIGQVFVPEKTNEITATKDLLDLLDVKDTVVTWDALNTQKENVAKVIEKKGDYVVALKANHPLLSEEVKDYFKEESLWNTNLEVVTYETVEKEHNAVIKREYILSKEIGWIYDRKSWKGLEAIGCIRKTIIPFKGEKITEIRYYMSSVTDVKLFARSVREHWGVESFHWQMDVTFRDDLNTTKEKNSVKNLQIMKKIVLALLKLVQPMYKMSMKNIRYSLALDFENEVEKIFTVLNVETVEKELKETGKIK